MFASSMVDRGFDPVSGENQALKCLFVASPLRTQLKRVRTKYNLLEIPIMCPSEEVCLSGLLFQ